MAEAEFAPIKMSGCDEERVKRVSKKNFLIPFTLSAKPAGEWSDIFDDIWHSYRRKSGAAKVQAYVRKSDIVLESALDGVKTHFENLRNAISATNEKYLEQLKQKAEKNEKKRKKREEERSADKAAVREALKGIDFS